MDTFTPLMLLQAGAQAASDIYTMNPKSWDVLLDGSTTRGCQAGLRDLSDDYVLVAFPGTHDKIDVERDLNCLVPFKHPVLGPIFTGAWDGVEDVLTQLRPALEARWEKQLILAGHSLGATRSLLAGGALCAAGTPPTLIVALAPAMPGYQQLADILTKVNIEAFRNRLDPVPECPPGRDWVQPRSLTHLSMAPSGGLFLIDDHACALYLKAILSIKAVQPS